jgi:hypothetical protein
MHFLLGVFLLLASPVLSHTVDVRKPVGGSDVEKTVDPDRKAIESLIAELRSPNKDPNPTNKYLVEYPKEYDWKAQRKVDTARQKLTELGRDAFPILIEHRDDKEYCCPLGEGANPLLSLSVGNACCLIISTQVDCSGGGYKSRTGSDGKMHGCRTYFSQFFKDREDTPGNAFGRWWKEHQRQSLREMQIEALRWAIAEERSIGFPDKKDEERYLQPLLTRLKEWTKDQ